MRGFAVDRFLSITKKSKAYTATHDWDRAAVVLPVERAASACMLMLLARVDALAVVVRSSPVSLLSAVEIKVAS